VVFYFDKIWVYSKVKEKQMNMKKNVFNKGLLPGSKIAVCLADENIKSLQSIFVELDNYFTSKLYGEFGSIPHEHTQVCSVAISPVLQKKYPSLMLGMENGHIALKDQKDGYIRAKTIDQLCKNFFKGFFSEGITITSQSELTFLHKNQKSKEDVSFKKKQMFRVSFTLRYLGASEPVIHDLLVVKSNWKLTKIEVIT
jgi:hypothetical protein